jgi:hypothetical protein
VIEGIIDRHRNRDEMWAWFLDAHARHLNYGRIPINDPDIFAVMEAFGIEFDDEFIYDNEIGENDEDDDEYDEYDDEEEYDEEDDDEEERSSGKNLRDEDLLQQQNAKRVRLF